MNRSTLLATVVAAVVLLSACQTSPSVEAPVPSGSAGQQTLPATPEAGGTPPAVAPSPRPTAGSSSTRPSPTPIPSSRLTQDAALLGEATKVNEEVFRLRMAWFGAGGVKPEDDLPPELDRLVMGEQRAKVLRDLHFAWEAQVSKDLQGEHRLHTVEQAALQLDGSLIAIHSCWDSRTVIYHYRRDNKRVNGQAIEHTSFYQRDTDGLLKMSDSRLVAADTVFCEY